MYEYSVFVCARKEPPLSPLNTFFGLISVLRVSEESKRTQEAELPLSGVHQPQNMMQCTTPIFGPSAGEAVAQTQVEGVVPSHLAGNG